MGQQAGKKKDKRERVTGLGRRSREEIAKVESNDSPEIPDRRETSDISFGGRYEPAFFCSSVVKSETIWLHSEEIKFGARVFLLHKY